MKKLLFFTLLSAGSAGSEQASAQRFLTDMMDTSSSVGKGLYPIYHKYDKLKFGGYMQPQFQWAETKGAEVYSGGDFAPNANNRFMLRRGRIRIDYAHYNTKGQPQALFAFQFDGTERGVAIRDFWGRFYENKLELFALTAGMFARPMGFEVNLSSSDRESPERGRMSQILMKTERDMGAMLTFEPRKKGAAMNWLKVDLGVFNGQGLAGPMDYDSHKDIIGRISLKPQKINQKGLTVSASVSGYHGGIVSQSTNIYKVSGEGSQAMMMLDSSSDNINRLTPRRYAGADVQLKIPNKKGFTELRAEYIRGLQTGTRDASETPGTYPVNELEQFEPLYTRQFDGAYFYFLQHLGREDLQLVLKYDWYDPNKKVKEREVSESSGFTDADIRYNTLGGGFVYNINAHVKATIYYDWIMNEQTDVAEFTSDKADNVFTVRLQYRF